MLLTIVIYKYKSNQKQLVVIKSITKNKLVIFWNRNFQAINFL